MAVLKCKMCGENLNITADEKVAECEFCGSRQTVASADSEKKINLFNRANRLRMNAEFDKAGKIYEQIISGFPEEPEAYWGLCLCNYGIIYADDPLTAKKIPVCHRVGFELFRKDINYESAIEYADTDARIFYQNEAGEIDRIRKNILLISEKEEPYDIFICCKETSDNGERTPDSVLAREIYESLTEKGYRVFFSGITLADKPEMQYEPYIFAALNSSKVMLVLGCDYDNINSAWVKNEWSRFLKLMAGDKNKVIIPCLKDMDACDMPDEFKGFQAKDCSKAGFMQDVLQETDKIIPEKAGENNAFLSDDININNPTLKSLQERCLCFWKTVTGKVQPFTATGFWILIRIM